METKSTLCLFEEKKSEKILNRKNYWVKKNISPIDISVHKKYLVRKIILFQKSVFGLEKLCHTLGPRLGH